MSGRWCTLAPHNYASALDEVDAYEAGTQPQLLEDFAAERGPQSQTPRQRFPSTSAFNTVTFSNPNMTFGYPSFGQATAAGDAGQLQLAVRYQF